MSLISQVLGWNVHECLDEHKFSNNVHLLSDTFQNEYIWSDSFNFHILEEIRASLQKDLESLNLMKVVDFGMDKSGLGHVEVGQDSAEGVMSGCIGIVVRGKVGSEFPKTSPHFFCKLLLPKSFDEHKLAVKTAEFGFNRFGSAVAQYFEEKDETWQLYLTSVGAVPFERIGNALQSRQFCTTEMMCEMMQCVTEGNQLNAMSFGPIPGRNESQVQAIDRILSVLSVPSIVKEDSCPRVQLVHGPPGTGKTATLVSLILAAIVKGRGESKVYASAPTNYAVCELARRTLVEVLATTEPFEYDGNSSALLPYQMVLVGDKRRLNLDEQLETLHHDTRVSAVKAHYTQFFHSVSMLRGFLRSAGAPGEDDNVDDKGLQAALMKLVENIAESCGVLVSQAPERMIDREKRGVFLAASTSLSTFLPVLKNLSPLAFAAWLRRRDTTDNAGLYAHFELLQQQTVQAVVAAQACLKPCPNVFKAVLEDASVVFSTVSTAGRDVMRRVVAGCDLVIIDEATQLVEAATAIMLAPRVRCLVLAGDNKQLPSTVISTLAERMGYGRSLFDRLLYHNFPKSLLNIQYRMHPLISAWPNATFYEGLLQDGPNVLSATYIKCWHYWLPPLCLLPVKGREEVCSLSGSKFNVLEVKVAVGILRKLEKQLKLTGEFVTVGLVTPYTAQVQHLEQSLGRVAFSHVDVVYKSVDGFQGQECDIIVFLTVRSNKDGRIGFLKDLRRMNVAITRPRFSLVIICNDGTLSSNKTWRSCLQNAEVQGGDLLAAGGDGGAVLKQVVLAHETLHNRLVAMKQSCVGEDMFEKCLWVGKISFVDQFTRDFKGVSSETEKGRVFEALFALAKGIWGKRKHAMSEFLKDVVSCIPLGNRHLVWSIDLQESKKNGVVTMHQRIKVLGLVASHGLQAFLSKVECAHRIFSDQYLARCRHRDENNTPKSWTVDGPFVKLAPAAVRDQASSAASASKEFSKSHPLSTSVAHLLLAAGGDVSVNLPHDVSADEQALIEEDGPHFVLGRSGTGKTTVMLYKMLRNDVLGRRHQLALGCTESEVVPYRQLMVTASPVLAAAIKGTFQSMSATAALTEGLSVAGTNGVKEAQGSITSAAISINNSNSFQEKSDSRAGLVPFDNCHATSFPLILTYDDCLRMVDLTLDKPFFGRTSDKRNSELVDYNRFVSRYVPQLGDTTGGDLSYKVEPPALYTEIISVIKGSLAAVESPDGRMSREAYAALSNTRHGEALKVAERHHLYNLFERYQQLKSYAPCDFDTADFVFHVFRALRDKPYSGPLVQAVFVDEVQDLTQAQLVILGFICEDPTGFFFAGDTAQTIAHGVGFRFEELKDLFYRYFIKQSCMKVPQVTQLKQNFRTHVQVLNLANTVIKLLLNMYPTSIDKVQDEESPDCGPMPVFLEDTDDIVSALFKRGEMTPCEFGSEQAILVRDDATKQKVRDVCGTQALVLTVLEAKGMEFTDILVYDFFSSSTLGAMWRVLGGRITGAFGVEPEKDAPKFKPFDAKAHHAICQELKKLYVLLTRARSRIFIFESDGEVREPILNIWTHPRIAVVELKSFGPDIETVLNAGAKSSPEEWCAKGREFLGRSNYEEGALCFSRGKDLYQEKYCRAKLAAQRGERLEVLNPGEAKRHFLEAAKIFLEAPLENLAESAKYFRLAREFGRAAELFERIKLWVDAGECYESSSNPTAAATAFVTGRALERGAEVCRKAHKYEHAVMLFDRVLVDSGSDNVTVGEEENYETAIRDKAVSLRSSLVKEGATHFAAKFQEDKMIHFVQLFESFDARRVFLKRRHFFHLLVGIELQAENFLAAAQLYDADGKYDQAATQYLRCKEWAGYARCVVKRARLGVWGHDFLPQQFTLTDESVVQKPSTRKGKGNRLGGNNQSSGGSTSTILSLSSLFEDEEVISQLPNVDSIQAELSLLSTSKELKLEQLSVYLEKIVKEWPNAERLQFITLRCLLRATCNAISLSGATQPPPQWSLVNELVTTLCSAVSTFQGVLTKMLRTNSRVGLFVEKPTGQDMRLFDQLLDLFEVSRNTMVPTAEPFFVDAIEATQLVWAECQPVITGGGAKGDKAKKPVAGGKRTTLSLDKLAGGINTFMSTVIKDSHRLLISQLILQLAAVFAGGITKQFLCHLQEVIGTKAVNSDRGNTAKQLQLLHKLFSLARDTSIDVDLAKTLVPVSNKHGVILEDMLLPVFGVFVDAQEVMTARCDPLFKAVLLQALPFPLQQKDLSFEQVARRLLLSEITGTTNQNCFQLEALLAQLQQGSGSKSTHNALKLLIRGFSYEIYSATVPRPVGVPSNKEKDVFLESLLSGTGFLTLRWTYAGNPIYLSKEGALTCRIAPFTFLALMEKQVVMLLMYQNKCNNVLLPQSLALDVLCRPNAAYCNLLDGCAAGTTVQWWEATHLVHGLLQTLLSILHCGRPFLNDWFAQTAKRAFGRNVECSDQTTSTFVIRAFQVMSTILCNHQSKHLGDCWNGLVNIGKNKDLTKGLPVIWEKYMNSLDSRLPVTNFNSHCQAVKDPLLLVCRDYFFKLPRHDQNARGKVNRAVIRVVPTLLEGGKKGKQMSLFIGAAGQALQEQENAAATVSVQADQQTDEPEVDSRQPSAANVSSDEAVAPPPPPVVEEIVEESDSEWKKVLRGFFKAARDYFAAETAENKFRRQMERSFTFARIDRAYAREFLQVALPTLMSIRVCLKEVGEVVSTFGDEVAATKESVSCGWTLDDAIDFQETLSVHWAALEPGSALHGRAEDVEGWRGALTAADGTIAAYQQKSADIAHRKAAIAAVALLVTTTLLSKPVVSQQSGKKKN